MRELQPQPGLRIAGLRRALGPPWLGLEHFRVVDERRGARPHVGLSVVTYLFEDSRGALLARVDGGEPRRIGPGGVGCLLAGRGAALEMRPERPGSECHGVRLLLGLCDADAAACSPHVEAADIPEVTARGVRVRVIAGTALGARSPLALAAHVTLLDVHLAPGAELGHVAPKDHQAWALAVLGDGVAGPAKHEVRVAEAAAVAFAPDGDAIRLRAGPSGLHVLLAHAPKH
jgi:redox-sensitive bicupin YhaK (pirin superfamily)